MIRVVLFLVFVACVAVGAAWLAERPGDVTITWLNHRIETSVMVAGAAIVLLAAFTVLFWSIVRAALQSPRRLARALRDRRRSNARRAISRGLIAIGAGDARAAQRFAREAGRLSAEEPLALLLSAQTAQLAGDRDGAERAFRAMAARSDTKLLGLRGLYVEAQRRGDAIAARRHAERAAEAAPGLSWAGQAVLQYRTATGDWAGALAALDSLRRGGQVDRDAYRRQRAVLLTARALGAADSDPRGALAFAREAASLAPDLAPAAALAGRLLAEAGELRKAAKVLEAAWHAQPHPDLAETYAHLRSGDSARERLARVQSLVRTRANHVESAFAVARATLDAQEFAAARAALAPLAAAPTQRAAMLMAELEEVQHGDVGRACEWMARALRAPRDAAWVTDGIVSGQWMPLSPVTGRLDAFEWKPPPGEPPPTLPALPERLIEQKQEAAEESPRPTTAPEPARLGRNGGAPAAAPAAEAAATGAAAAVEVEEVDEAPLARKAPASAARPVIPLVHAPDDPGPPEPKPAPANGLRRLFFFW